MAVHQGFDVCDQSAFSRKVVVLSSVGKILSSWFAFGILVGLKPLQDLLPVEWIN